MTFGAIPLIFSTVYHFEIQTQGAIFSAISIASILFTVICIYQEKFAKARNKLPNSPESRLYFSCVESTLMPIGMFLYGWSSRADVHWIVPTIAIALATMGIFSVYLAVFNYLADVYHRYASSALAAQSFCRASFSPWSMVLPSRMISAVCRSPTGTRSPLAGYILPCQTGKPLSSQATAAPFFGRPPGAWSYCRGIGREVIDHEKAALYCIADQ